MIGCRSVKTKDESDLFKNRNYFQAAQKYEQMTPTKESLQNLGDCYYYNFQMSKATKSYSQLFASFKEGVNDEVKFRYANALKGIKNFDKGDSIMTAYVGTEQNTPRFMKSVSRNSPFSFKFDLMSKSKSNGDFGIAFYGNKVVFASARNSVRSKYQWNDKPYLDLYSADVNKNGELINIVSFSDAINTEQHESSATFSADGKTMYFDRTSDKRVKVGEEFFASVKMYKAEFKNNKWTNVTLVPFSSDDYSVEHPFLTKDGKKLYFASDMKGSVGSFDIYVVDVNENGTYSQPRNLGVVINTVHREQFPFVSDNGTLYFASDGHQGNGNLDVFMSAKLNDTEYDKPINLGSTINSEMDDFNFIIDEANNKGYFSSNRTGDDNLYAFTREKNKLDYLVEGDVRDKKTAEILPGTLVKLYDDHEVLLEEILVGKDGNFIFNTEPNKKYKVMAFKDFYIPSESILDTSKNGKVYINLQMKVESYYDAEDIINKKEDGTVLIELENIYFDLNKWDIKPQAAQVLDVLVGLLKKYPYMEILIGSHTDSRASSGYNLRLSHKRAASALDYLVQNGIDKKRLKSIGYGETRPLIICPKNDCTEEEYAVNRRCTFMILK